jgi:hypothetical protein
MTKDRILYPNVAKLRPAKAGAQNPYERETAKAASGCSDLFLQRVTAHSAFSLRTETRSARVGTVALRDRYAGDLIAEHCAAFTAEMLHVERFVFLVRLD